MKRKQRFILALLALANLAVLGGVAVGISRSLNNLPKPLSPAPTPSPYPTGTRTPSPTPSPTPSRTPRPTETSGPTHTPTQTPAPTPTPLATLPADMAFGTLDEFWAGDARWMIELYDVGLPMDTSDTIYRGGGEFWSYAHADHRAANIVDSCGEPVPYPGCVTLWKSYDGGETFSLVKPACLFSCDDCPCDEDDHVQQQQYPRVFVDGARIYMVYEWGGGTIMRVTDDGVHWSGEAWVLNSGVWYTVQRPCEEEERVGEHPHVAPEFDCLAGAPPGIYVEDDQLYVFVGMGRAPGHMGCYVGNKHGGTNALSPCEANPLFGAETGYGPRDALGMDANEYFDFRTISSADVVRVGERYYMTYEGTRGPSDPSVREDQFALGFARSISDTIDGPWEKYPENPVIMNVTDNWGVGHADIVLVGPATYLYTATSQHTRGRYVLVQR